jgi:hypothetical protein
MCVVIIWSSLFHYAFEALRSHCFIMAEDKIQLKLENFLFNFWLCSWSIMVVYGLLFKCVIVIWSSLFHYAFEALKSPCFIMAKDNIQQKKII